jgi:putative NIF3 family GTP cyclohydrolase 1 type 2
MNARQLYERLDRDFAVNRCVDEWGPFVEVNEFIHPGFQERWIGVMLDNAREIRRVYTVTMPDTAVLEAILAREEADVLVFSHHAMGYDPAREGFPFYNIPGDCLRRMREQRVALYVMHAPLDYNGPYSTSVSLAKALGLAVVGEFCEYLGCQVGVLCEATFAQVADFAGHVERVVGHQVKLWPYGDATVAGGRVALAAGGGCMGFIAEELTGLGVNTYLTGVTRPTPGFEPSMAFHRLAREGRVNVLGATHYSTEKYACLAMVDYFGDVGLDAEFVAGTPCLADLGT